VTIGANGGIMTETGLKERLREDLTAAMKARDALTTATLRLALTAITNAEVAGTSAKELSDAEIVAVLNKELRKRGEAAEAFEHAGRAEQAAKERAEADVLSGYLPAPLTDDQIAGLVRKGIDSVTTATGSVPTMRQMGLVVKEVQARAAGRADGSRIAAAVRAALG